MDYVFKRKVTMRVHMFCGWNCFDLNMGVGGERWGIRHFCKLFCLQTSFSGDFLVVQPNYYFVNCNPIDTNCRLKEKEDGGFFFFFV